MNTATVTHTNSHGVASLQNGPLENMAVKAAATTYQNWAENEECFALDF
jgi:hypothetical protein